MLEFPADDLFSDLVKQTANSYGEARITLTSSYGYKAAKKLDYMALTTIVPDDGTSFLHLGGGMQRYLDSKLAVLYFAMELDKILWASGVHNVFVNSCHPGKMFPQKKEIIGINSTNLRKCSTNRNRQ